MSERIGIWTLHVDAKGEVLACTPEPMPSEVVASLRRALARHDPTVPAGWYIAPDADGVATLWDDRTVARLDARGAGELWPLIEDTFPRRDPDADS